MFRAVAMLVAAACAGCGRIAFDSRLDASADAVPGAWYSVDWSYRKPITIATGQVRADLAHFPVAIVTVDPDLAARARPDGNDLVFTMSDGVTKLPHELERYGAGGALAGWVTVPMVAAAADTTLYLYYGNPAATSQQDATTTWSDFRAVWHMADTPGPSGALRDSSPSMNTGTFQNMTGADQVAGQAGGALNFDGTNNFVAVTSSASLAFGDGVGDSALTIEAWVFMRSAAAFKIAAKGPAPPPLEYYFRTGDQTDDLLLFRVYDSTASYLGRRYSVGLTPLQNRWTHLAATYDGSRTASGLALYVDGERVDDQDASSGAYTAMMPTASTLDIGRYVSGANFTNGLIDDLRIAATNRSPAWIQASYANLATPAAFTAIGAEEPR
jgi:hypothetical protein